MKNISLALIVLLSFTACATKNISIGGDSTAAFNPILPGAPAQSSPEDVKDYQTLLELHKTRTKADCARGASEVKINLENFYGPAYGPLTAAEVKKWQPIFDKLANLAWPLIGIAKDKWQRPRPFNAHADLTPCVKLEKSFSYPSGHAAMSHYFMHLLEQLKPEQKDAIVARAEQIAHDRNIVGVHYPSDVRDGKVLGDEIYDFRKNDAQFGALLERAKAL